MEKRVAQVILSWAEAATESLNKSLLLAKEHCDEGDLNHSEARSRMYWLPFRPIC
jgi:hypothetical protein